ncbi:MAG: putative toxin-antitoxin system toxin component, PIN family [Oceanipulchritudo sp.]
MRVVLDTNVVVSACFGRGVPFDCLTAWAKGRYHAVISPPLLAEYEEVYEELHLRCADRKAVDWVTALGECAELVFPVERIAGATADPFDDMVLECAVAAEADFLVSGDKRHLLPLGHFREIPILPPAEFLRRL